MHNMINEFIAYQTQQDPTQDWSSNKTWEATGDPMGRFLAIFSFWAVWKKVPTLSLLTLQAKDIRYAYEDLYRRFPHWTTHRSPAEGINFLKNRSPVYRDALNNLCRIFVNRTADIQRAHPLFLSDCRRFRECMAPTPTGYRNVALIYTLHESGARGIAFTEAFMEDPRYDHSTHRWTIYYEAQKRRGTELSLRAVVLSKEASKVFGMFWDCRDMVDWPNPSALFGVSSTEGIDQILVSMCETAGYPKRFFSSHSARAGALTNEICQSLLDGKTPGEAHMNARVMGDFGVNSDALRSYIRPMADIVRKHIGKVASMGDLSVLDLHPELEGYLPGPFRKKKIITNVKESQRLSQDLWSMVDYLAIEDEPTAEDLYPTTNPRKKDGFLFTLLAKKLRRSDQLDPMMDWCAQKYTPGVKGYTLDRAVGTVLRTMMLCRTLEPGHLDEPNHKVAPTQHMLDYFEFDVLQDDYIQPEKPVSRYNAAQSTNIHLLAQSAQRRRMGRATAVVMVGQNHYDVTKLSQAQLDMLADAQNSRRRIDQGVFEMAGNVEDYAEE